MNPFASAGVMSNRVGMLCFALSRVWIMRVCDPGGEKRGVER